jgi:hypothetical protein
MTRRGVLPAGGITAGHFGRADEFAFRASDFMGYTAPWYSARDAGSGLLAGRGFGWLGCYVHTAATWAGFLPYRRISRDGSAQPGRPPSAISRGSLWRPADGSGGSFRGNEDDRLDR